VLGVLRYSAPARPPRAQPSPARLRGENTEATTLGPSKGPLEAPSITALALTAVGAMLREGREVGAGRVGSALTYSAAAAALFLDGMLQVGPELSGSTAFADGESPVEALVDARLCLPLDLVVGAGLGAALTRAPSAAAFRGLASLSWEPGGRCVGPDADGDGEPDSRDRCSHRAGTAPEGCPPDSDADGIPDADDACATEPGQASADRSRHGCPPDSDGDGVPDARDRCPMVASRTPDGCPADGYADGIPDGEDACPELAGLAEHRGCPPPDADGDSVADPQDACPDQPGTPDLGGCPPPAPDGDGDGVADTEDAANGSPAQAEMRGDAIEIREQIRFALGTATIEPVSEGTLAAVAALLRERPTVRLGIEGHTDSSSPRELNLELSEQRAESVRSWLVDQGRISAERLSAVGFGPDRPIASNDTPEERAKNRRVELRVVAR
jgi:outer membrane protein OmpA-like peptidoglycan-associated protein